MDTLWYYLGIYGTIFVLAPYVFLHLARKKYEILQLKHKEAENDCEILEEFYVKRCLKLREKLIAAEAVNYELMALTADQDEQINRMLLFMADEENYDTHWYQLDYGPEIAARLTPEEREILNIG